MVGQDTVIYDACVLYPAPLRSLLMYLGLADLFRPRWTDEIHREWMRSVRRDFPDITQAQVERIRELMNAHVPECLVTGYEALIPGLSLPDPHDRHVLAAAIQCGADTIVTANLADFPSSELDKYGISVQHPDDFVADWLAVAPEAVCLAAQRQRLSLKNPPLTFQQYLASLERQRLSRTVAALQEIGETEL